jgi:hypothetical protein
MTMEIIDGCGNRYMRAMIATHAIYGYGNVQFRALKAGINRAGINWAGIN